MGVYEQTKPHAANKAVYGYGNVTSCWTSACEASLRNQQVVGNNYVFEELMHVEQSEALLDSKYGINFLLGKNDWSKELDTHIKKNRWW